MVIAMTTMDRSEVMNHTKWQLLCACSWTSSGFSTKTSLCAKMERFLLLVRADSSQRGFSTVHMNTLTHQMPSCISLGVSFGMMFGSRTGTAEDWSTEDEADIEECDEESVEFEELYDSETEEGLNSEGNAWEPPAKHYSQMDLKEEVHKERQLKLSEITEQDIEVTEEIRRLKNAKRRAEKRRKQKDKKVQEAVAKAEEEEELQHLEECKRREEEEAAQKLEDDMRCIM